MGIDEEGINKVYDFGTSVVDKNLFNSNGLGLNMVKKIVVNHGGKIGVESKLGSSTKFTFTVLK